jgi:hypothetical protein
MKQLLLLLASCICLQIAIGQTTLRVCSYVDGNGKTTTAQNIFTIRDGDELKMLVNSDKNLETSRLDYKIYRVSSSGYASYDVTISQDVETNWVWAYKGIIFHSAGFYLIKVYTRDGTYMCENLVYIDWSR